MVYYTTIANDECRIVDPETRENITIIMLPPLTDSRGYGLTALSQDGLSLLVYKIYHGEYAEETERRFSKYLILETGITQVPYSLAITAQSKFGAYGSYSRSYSIEEVLSELFSNVHISRFDNNKNRDIIRKWLIFLNDTSPFDYRSDIWAIPSTGSLLYILGIRDVTYCIDQDTL
jgi:hypothetical protein